MDTYKKALEKYEEQVKKIAAAIKEWYYGFKWSN
jgi:hypothetical protein